MYCAHGHTPGARARCSIVSHRGAMLILDFSRWAHALAAVTVTTAEIKMPNLRQIWRADELISRVVHASTVVPCGCRAPAYLMSVA